MPQYCTTAIDLSLQFSMLGMLGGSNPRAPSEAVVAGTTLRNIFIYVVIYIIIQIRELGILARALLAPLAHPARSSSRILANSTLCNVVFCTFSSSAIACAAALCLMCDSALQCTTSIGSFS